MFRFKTLAAALALALALPAYGQPQVLRLDPGQTRVTFVLDSALHTVHGTLQMTDGEIRFDPRTGAASGRIRLDARRAATGNSSRDKKMHSQVLESARYPEIVFTAERVEGALREAGRSDLTIHGTVAIHGASHPVTLAAAVTRAGDRLSASTGLTVPYVEWGLKDPSLMLLRVSPRVEVQIEAKGQLTPG
jgi:polyisoprenoid-binding protein YceI